MTKPFSGFLLSGWVVLACLGLASGQAHGQQSERDITEILDEEAPSTGNRAKLREIADAQPPSGASPQELAKFYQKRGNAAGSLGRLQQSLSDLRQALELAQRDGGGVRDIARDLFTNEMTAGNYVGALSAAQARVEAEKEERPPRRIAGLGMLVRALIQNGRIRRAREVVDGMHRIINRLPSRVPAERRSFFRSQVLDAEGRLLRLTGQSADAERVLAEAIAETRASMGLARGDEQLAKSLRTRLTAVQLEHARVLVTLGREVEAEAEAREMLLQNLQADGKYTSLSVLTIQRLALIVNAQGRFTESETLGREAEKILDTLGAPRESLTRLRVRMGVARSLAGQRRWTEAADIVRDVEAVAGDDKQLRNKSIGQTADPAMIYYKVGDIEAGLRLSRAYHDRREKRLGPKHYETAVARGFVAIGEFLSGDIEAALAGFRAAVPILLSSSRNVDSEESAVTARELRKRAILDGYMGVLAKVYDNLASADERAAVAAEAFLVSDAARGSSVQRAVAQSSARAAARDPQLAELVRKEQDRLREIGALFSLLTDLLSAPPDQRDDDVVQDLRDEIDDLRGERAEVREELEDRFPDYVRLIDPRPAELAQVRASLADDEVALITYVTDEQTYVWAFGKAGPTGFTTVPLDRERLGAVASQLRRALDPAAATLADIPDFDTALAHRLYTALMAPVAEAWKGAPHLVVIADGPLGQVPFSLLPTEAGAPEADTAALFDRYRQVAWLTRTHSVTVMPSAASLIALRALPPGDQAQRPFVGFGDPLFNAEQVAAAAVTAPSGGLVNRGGLKLRNVPVHLRSLPQMRDVDEADLGLLPRLPDTADEIRAMAAATRADPSRDVFLGKSASEPTLHQTPLADYRVVAFATHGLVPGDLKGLFEPALAMTAPTIAGDKQGDGLLTMGEIFELEMNAEWVVLSACNTGTGAGAGAEAVSGLGRAFFYAGTRALLVSNWPVETTSARILTTDVFSRQAANANLARAEALRQAQVALIDGPGLVDTATGKPVFSYGHPIFWAPFSLIGEGRGIRIAPQAPGSPATEPVRRATQERSSRPAAPQQVFGD